MWRRLAATAPIGPLAWEPPYAARAALEKEKKKDKKKKKEEELQLLTYATVTAMQHLSYVCKLHYSLGQCRILDPLSEARD